MTKEEDIQNEMADNVARVAARIGPVEAELMHRLDALLKKPEAAARLLAIGQVAFVAATELLHVIAPDIAQLAMARGFVVSKAFGAAAEDVDAILP